MDAGPAFAHLTNLPKKVPEHFVRRAETRLPVFAMFFEDALTF